MSPAPKITDTQTLYTVIGDMSAKVNDLHENQGIIFDRLRGTELAQKLQEERCKAIQEAKAVKEAADEKAKSRGKAIADAVLIFVLVTAIGLVGGACYQLWQAHIKATTEIVNPK